PAYFATGRCAVPSEHEHATDRTAVTPGLPRRPRAHPRQPPTARPSAPLPDPAHPHGAPAPSAVEAPLRRRRQHLDGLVDRQIPTRVEKVEAVEAGEQPEHMGGVLFADV